MLVDAPGQNGICKGSTDDRPYRRTAVCSSGEDFALIVTEQPVLLYDLAEWLAAPKEKGGLACNSALNLSGDSSSGALYRSGGASAAWRKFGDGTFPLATLIVIGQRPNPPSASGRVPVPSSLQSVMPPGGPKAAKRFSGPMGPLEPGISYSQGDMYDRPSSTAQQCATLCYNDYRCLAATYIDSQQRCWLKNSIGPIGRSTDMTSSRRLVQ